MNVTKSQDVIGASVTRGSTQSDQMEVIGRYRAECLDAQGNVKWVEDFDNLVTTEGKNFLLDTVFIAGSAGTGTLTSTSMFFRMAFIGTNTTALATMTYAIPTYTEIANTVITARGSPTFSAASAGAKSTSAAVSASIAGAGGTVYGVSIVALNAAAVGNLGVVADTATSGAKLYSMGLFASAKVVSSGDTLNVTYTTTLT